MLYDSVRSHRGVRTERYKLIYDADCLWMFFAPPPWEWYGMRDAGVAKVADKLREPGG